MNDGMMGQNYWFNGCMDYVMECLGESREYNYWFFSGVTGDSFTQVYSKNPRCSTLCLTDRLLSDVIDKAFDACGYNYDFVVGINADNRAAYYDRIREYIDREIPVIAKSAGNNELNRYGVICGYENDNFYYLLGEDTEPTVYPERFFQLVFVGEKKDCPSPADVYRQTVMAIPAMLTKPATKDFSFGKQAFVDWANSFQNGMFDNISIDDPVWYTHSSPAFACWSMHGNYLCMVGTNGCAMGFLHRALELNPDMTFIEQLFPLFQKHNGNGFHTLIGMEGGFGLPPKVIKNKARMKPISDAIMTTGNIIDEICNVFAKQ